MLTLDGSDFLKQGQESVGVKRQYCGEVGKRANCQAGVFLGYASHKGYTLLDRRLYLPHEWVEDEAYAERRRRCGVPTDMPFKTKPTLGWEMIQAVQQAGTLRCRWVTCDEAFGRDTDCLDRVAELGLWYFAEVPHDTQVWRQRPATAVPAWSGQGRKPTRTRVLAGEADTRRGGPTGRLAARRPLGASHDQGGEQRAAGRPLCGAARRRRARGVARPRGLAGPAAQPPDRGAEDLPVQRPSGHPAGHAGTAERHALAHRDLFRGRQTVPRDGRL